MLYVYEKYWEQSLRNDIAFIVIYFIITLILTRFSNYYDFPSTFFFLLLFILFNKKKYFLSAIVFILACLNQGNCHNPGPCLTPNEQENFPRRSVYSRIFNHQVFDRLCFQRRTGATSIQQFAGKSCIPRKTFHDDNYYDYFGIGNNCVRNSKFFVSSQKHI